MKRIKDCYLVRWKVKGMLFTRWNFCFDDSVLCSESDHDRLILHKRNGATVDVCYADTVVIYSKSRARIKG